MDSLSHSILVSIFFVLALLFTLYIRNQSVKRYQHQRYQQGILWLEELRQLLTQTQQHRGLVNGYLHGDIQNQSRIAKLQASINHQASKLVQLGAWIQHNERWNAIADHWSKLSANYMNHQAHYALEQHNKLILNVLHLIEDCAEQHHLQELNTDKNVSVEHLWKSLLFNAEFIGQARAIGTGVTAAKSCSSVERIRLKYLHSQLRDYQSSSTSMPRNDELDRLLKSIEEQVIVTEPSMTSTEYFNLATRALEAVMLEFDRQLSKVAQQVTNKTLITSSH